MVSSEREPVLVQGICRTCGATRQTMGLGGPAPIEAALRQLQAYECDEGDHYFAPGQTLWEAYEWDLSKGSDTL